MKKRWLWILGMARRSTMTYWLLPSVSYHDTIWLVSKFPFNLTVNSCCGEAYYTQIKPPIFFIISWLIKPVNVCSTQPPADVFHFLKYTFQVKGLTEALNDNNVCSIYRADLAAKTYQCLNAMKQGNAVFTLPNAPIKCSGAGQKICYLADEIFRKVIFTFS